MGNTDNEVLIYKLYCMSVRLVSLMNHNKREIFFQTTLITAVNLKDFLYHIGWYEKSNLTMFSCSCHETYGVFNDWVSPV